MSEYYIDPVLGDDANPGTLSAPWKTLMYAYRRSFPYTYLQPGDTVWLRGGRYNGSGQYLDCNANVGALSGTDGSPITFAAYGGENPIFYGNFSGSASAGRAVLLKTVDYWSFIGITFENNYQHAWFLNCNHISCVDCSFINGAQLADGGSTYSGVGFYTDLGSAPAGTTEVTCNHNHINNCLFSKWGYVTDGGNDNGVSISFGNETTDEEHYYNLIENCTFIHGAHDHFGLNSAYNVIRNNLFVNEAWMTNTTWSPDSMLPAGSGNNPPAEVNPYGGYGNRHTKPGDAGTVQNDMRNVFEGNRFLYTGPPPDDFGAFGIELGTRRGIYRNNVIAFSLAAGIYFNTSGTTSESTKNCVYNNVIYGNGLANVYGGTGMQSYDYGIGMSTFEDRRTGNYVVNNIVRNNEEGNLDPDILEDQECRGNLSDDNVDPLFVDEESGYGFVYDENDLPDFSLTENSPCLGAGVFLAFCSGAGSGTELVLDNSLYFSDGNRCVEGDTIQLEGSEETAVILENDWENNTLTLDAPLTWGDGQGVALPYVGDAPDQGLLQTTLAPPATSPPTAPTNLTITAV